MFGACMCLEKYGTKNESALNVLAMRDYCLFVFIGSCCTLLV